jgi:hypothetical protein
MSIVAWWNLIFLLPAFAALLYLILLATGTVAGDTGDIDADVDVDLDLDVDADVDAGEFHGIEHAVGSADIAQPSGLAHVLSLVGIGRAPLSLLLISFSFLWGLIGWLANGLFSTFIASPAVFVWLSVAVALVVSLFLTRLLASGLHRFLPATETYAISNRQLVGRLASVRYAVSDRNGTAQLYDDQGRLHEVPVRVLPGEDPIPAQRTVILWRYDAVAEAFLVTPEDNSSEVDAPRHQYRIQEEVR